MKGEMPKMRGTGQITRRGFQHGGGHIGMDSGMDSATRTSGTN